MKTIILSCGTGTKSQELLESVNIDDYEQEVIYFPETRFHSGMDVPLCNWEQLLLLDKLKGKVIVTVSEIIIMMFLREVRQGRMRTDEVEIYCGDRHMEITTSGDFLVVGQVVSLKRVFI